MSHFDIDIDVQTGFNRERFGVRATQYLKPELKIKAHPSGVYPTGAPVDPISGLCAIDYKEAERLGFRKLDLINNSHYNAFNNKQDVLDSLNQEPNWKLLEDEKFIKGIPQLGKHLELIRELKPRSVDDLADVLALIRPGKQHLLEPYKMNKGLTRNKLYQKPTSGKYYYKKSHAYATAFQIVAVMNSKDKQQLVIYK